MNTFGLNFLFVFLSLNETLLPDLMSFPLYNPRCERPELIHLAPSICGLSLLKWLSPEETMNALLELQFLKDSFLNPIETFLTEDIMIGKFISLLLN